MFQVKFFERNFQVVFFFFFVTIGLHDLNAAVLALFFSDVSQQGTVFPHYIIFLAINILISNIQVLKKSVQPLIKALTL